MNEAIARLRSRLAGRRGGDRAGIAGAAATLAWVLLVLLFWLAGPSEGTVSGLGRLAALVGVVLPLVLIWTAVGLARMLADLRAEAAMLRARMEALRPEERAAADRDAALPAAPGRTALGALRPAPRPARPEQKQTGLRAGEPRQSDLPLDPPAPVHISPGELVAALDFPDGPDDHAAIAALRTALANPETARCIRAAQDVITLLAGHGVYMDDLPDSRADAQGWRRFLEGQRSGAQALGDIGDLAALDTAAMLMREDEVFRDAGHHFLRQYDRTLSRAAAGMDDPALAAAADTRSGRAFRLLAQVTGMFG